MRAVSTAVDATLFLVLLSAAVTTLTLAAPVGSDDVTVDERANVLASSTAEIEYTLRGVSRQAHGTVASLLGRLAVANATIDDRALSETVDSYDSRVRTLTRSTTGTSNRTEVVARWTPYRGAPVEGSVRVGTRPPPSADVTVAKITVPAPAPPVETNASSRGFEEVARATATATAEALITDSRAGLAPSHESPATVEPADRFRTLAAATGASVEAPLSRGNVSLAHSRLVDGLTDRFARDMREQFATPAAAASAVRTDTVTITLRRWDL